MEQGVRIDRSLRLDVPRDRVVRELDRALLRDRVLELGQATRHLGRVVRIADGDSHGGFRSFLVEARAAEGEILEGEAQGLGVGELALEAVERRLQRREFVLFEPELGQKVVLGAQGVELFAGELVSLRVEGDSEVDQLRAVRVEPAGERLVRHFGIALDSRLDVPGGQRPPLRHEEGNE